MDSYLATGSGADQSVAFDFKNSFVTIIDTKGRVAPGIGNSRTIHRSTPHLIDQHLARVLTKRKRRFTLATRVSF